MSKTFVCSNCGGTFDCGDENESLAELVTNFPGYKPEECEAVCDACYEAIMEGIANET